MEQARIGGFKPVKRPQKSSMSSRITQLTKGVSIARLFKGKAMKTPYSSGLMLKAEVTSFVAHPTRTAVNSASKDFGKFISILQISQLSDSF
jgi:hypothetical protein